MGIDSPETISLETIWQKPSKARYPFGMDRDEVINVLRAFEEHELEYVLIGAAAMGFHGIVRATEDLDSLIRAIAENVDE